MKHLLLLVSLGGVLSAAPTNIVPDECAVIRYSGNGKETVYTGTPDDPHCRVFDPRVGVDDITVDNGGYVEEIALPYGQEARGLYIRVGDVSLSPYEHAKFFSTPTEEYYTIFSVGDLTFNVRANISGSGYARLVGALSLPEIVSWGGNPIFHPADIWINPVFRLGQESLIATVTFHSTGLPNSETEYHAYRWSETFAIEEVDVPSQVPEPSTALLALLATGWMIWLRRRRAATA
ncbi:MAG TPA: PEP-CTERM sorting domain-containing protein [Bryobacteraceae bacterium]|nr:PEP-CTERM sorting domain-containing protein [Bryobacteraceae bacterium]